MIDSQMQVCLAKTQLPLPNFASHKQQQQQHRQHSKRRQQPEEKRQLAASLSVSLLSLVADIVAKFEILSPLQSETRRVCKNSRHESNTFTLLTNINTTTSKSTQQLPQVVWQATIGKLISQSRVCSTNWKMCKLLYLKILLLMSCVLQINQTMR